MSLSPPLSSSSCFPVADALPMSVSARGRALMMALWPCRLTAWVDGDRVRVGYGHVLRATFDYPRFEVSARELGQRLDRSVRAGRWVGPALSVSLAEAEALLVLDVRQTELFLNSVVARARADAGDRRLSQGQFDAVAALVQVTSQGLFAMSRFRRLLGDGEDVAAAGALAEWPLIRALFEEVV